MVIIPVYNPDNKFSKLLNKLVEQSMKNVEVLLIFSGMDKIYQKYIPERLNPTIREIKATEFNH